MFRFQLSTSYFYFEYLKYNTEKYFFQYKYLTVVL